MIRGILLTTFLWSSTGLASDDIIVLQSDDLDEYSVPAQAFKEQLNRRATIYSINGKKKIAENIIDDLRTSPPELIFALGAKAAWIVKNKLPDVPMLYAQVRNPKRYGITGDNIAGINMEPPVDLTLSQFQLFVPSTKNIVFFVSAKNRSPMIQKALQTAKQMKLKPTKITVNSTKELRKALSKLNKDTDLIWLLPDSTVITPDNFYHITNVAQRAMIPTLVSSYHLVKAGSFMSITADHKALGKQAAGIAEQILDGKKALFNTEIQPEEVHVVLNSATQKTIQLKIAEHNMDFVNEVISNK